MSKNTGDGELDKIIEDLWSAAVLDTVNTIQKTKPKNSTYVSDNIWYAKTAIKKWAAQEANKALVASKQELIDDLEEAIMLPGRKADWLKAWLKDEKQKLAQLTKEKESSDE